MPVLLRILIEVVLIFFFFGRRRGVEIIGWSGRIKIHAGWMRAVITTTLQIVLQVDCVVQYFYQGPWWLAIWPCHGPHSFSNGIQPSLLLWTALVWSSRSRPTKSGSRKSRAIRWKGLLAVWHGRLYVLFSGCSDEKCYVASWFAFLCASISRFSLSFITKTLDRYNIPILRVRTC